MIFTEHQYRTAISDITARKQTEEALRDTEAQLREVLENSLDASYKRNLQTDAYDYLSPVFARISGYTPDEMKTLPTQTVLEMIHPADLPDIERVLARSMAGAAGAADRMEYRFKHKDGPYRWLCDQFAVMRAADGQPLARVGSVSDITERKQAEAALRAVHAELLEKNIALHEANASKDKFFSIIAHDLKSPFNGLLGYLDLMGRQSGDLSAAQLKAYLAKLTRSANALYALLENLLAWARLQRGLAAYRPEVIALAPLMNEIVGLFAANAAHKAITLTQAVPAAVLVSADMAMLNTILRNLMSNALKFTPAGASRSRRAALPTPWKSRSRIPAAA